MATPGTGENEPCLEVMDFVLGFGLLAVFTFYQE